MKTEFLSTLNSLYEKTPEADKTRFQIKLMLSLVIDSDAPRATKLDLIFAATKLAYLDAQLLCLENLLRCQGETKVSLDKIITVAGKFLLEKENLARSQVANIVDLFAPPAAGRSEEKK